MKPTPARAEDRGPIVDSWLASYRNQHTAGLIPMGEWGDVMVPVLQDILDRSTVLVIRGTVGDTFYGWLAHEGDQLLHYAYVWKPYRKKGVGKALLAAAGLRPRFLYSCRTGAGERYARHLNPRPKFDPLYARFGSTPEQRKAANGPEIIHRR